MPEHYRPRVFLLEPCGGAGEDAELACADDQHLAHLDDQFLGADSHAAIKLCLQACSVADPDCVA